MAKKTIEVTIGGEQIKLKTPEEEITYVQDLAKKLDNMINDRLVRGTTKQKATIMIAFDLLNENNKLKVLFDDLHD